jgi:hypothetical protein
MDEQEIAGQTTVDEQIEDAAPHFFDADAPVGELGLPEGMTPEAFAEAKAAFIAQHGGPDAIENLSDAAAAALAGPTQVQLPVMQIPLAGANIKIVPGEQPGEKTVIVGPIVISFVLALSADGARSVATDLTGGIQLATAADIPKLELAR